MKSIFDEIYELGINIRITSLWDGGYFVCFDGDEKNGWRVTRKHVEGWAALESFFVDCLNLIKERD